VLSSSEIKSMLEKEPKFDDIFCSLRATGKQPKGIIKEAKEVIAIARKFNEEIVRKQTIELDLISHENPDDLPWDYMKEANKWGFFTMFVPKIFGGKGYSMSTLGYFCEEISSVCLGLATLTCAHYLGYGLLISSWNMRVINKISREIVEGEKNGKPCLLSLAITEADAGTDSQNIELMDTGNLVCHAKKTDDGYILNGSKIFISAGHLSTWHITHAYTDLNKGSESTVMLAVKTGSKGFSFGKKEKKMGQKVCPASELVFSDCFVPDDLVCIDNRKSKKLSKAIYDTNAQIFAYIWGGSRTGVGGFGTGAARGAFEEALKFASENKLDGKLMINHSWCQATLAEMYSNVAVARASYSEANYVNGLHGLWKLLNIKPLYYLLKLTPLSVLDIIFKWFNEKEFSTWFFRKLCLDLHTDDEIRRIDGWGALAKIVGTDKGMENCRLALELMGHAGVRHNNRIEKIYRDAKLLQIYEGTNQVNRMIVFKRLVAGKNPDACVFSANTN